MTTDNITDSNVQSELTPTPRPALEAWEIALKENTGRMPLVNPKLNPMNNVRAEFNTSLQMLGMNPGEYQTAIDRLMKDIATTVTTTVEEGDLTVLKYMRTQIASHFQRTSLGQALRQNSATLLNTIVTTVSMLIKFS